ncbi:MAG: hypothetical protein Q7S65_03325 [Nanoarchaeota archaeon]|nr:hypothetical protein [Nanoarchaeota archaeon]
MGILKEKSLKKVTPDKSRHFRYGIYGGLVIVCSLFLYGLLRGVLRVVGVPYVSGSLTETLINVVLVMVLWFYIGFKALDRVRAVCSKFNPFLVLFVMWATSTCLTVFIIIFGNFIHKEPLSQGVERAFNVGAIISLLVIEYFYKRSRRKKSKVISQL